MTMTTEMDYSEEIEAWARARRAALFADDGWLNLTDRVEAPRGRHSVGSDAGCDLRLSAGPEQLGTLEIMQDGSATLTHQDRTYPFQPEPDTPPRLRIAGLLLEVMTVEGQQYLRVRDLSHPALQRPVNLPRYPVQPEWRIWAQWHVFDRPKAARIDLVGGAGAEITLTHEARFVHEGTHVNLLATHWKSGLPMFVFRDSTAGVETYGASRFLIGKPKDDVIVLDFNTAFNPPCAFSEHAVCPLPPPQNILRFPIRAGERLPG